MLAHTGRVGTHARLNTQILYIIYKARTRAQKWAQKLLEAHAGGKQPHEKRTYHGSLVAQESAALCTKLT